MLIIQICINFCVFDIIILHNINVLLLLSTLLGSFLKTLYKNPFNIIKLWLNKIWLLAQDSFPTNLWGNFFYINLFAFFSYVFLFLIPEQTISIFILQRILESR